MIDKRDKIDVEATKRKYKGIIAAISRASILFGVNCYLDGIVHNHLIPDHLSGRNDAVKILFVVDTEVQWRSLVRHLIDNEGFYQGNVEEGFFHKRGSLVTIRPVREGDVRIRDAFRVDPAVYI